MNAYLKPEMLPVILVDTVSLVHPIFSQCLRDSDGVKFVRQQLQRKHVPTSSSTSNKTFMGCTRRGIICLFMLSINFRNSYVNLWSCGVFCNFPDACECAHVQNSG